MALIGQNKGALRSPAGLSRVNHPQVCPCSECTEAGINSRVTVPSKVRASKDSTKTRATCPSKSVPRVVRFS